MPFSITSITSEDNAIFKETLEKCSIYLEITGGSYKISKHQSLVILELEKELSEHHDSFFAVFKNLCSDEDEFIKALKPTLYQLPDETNSFEQDSIVRILLNIPRLQNDIIEMLMDRLTTISSEDTIEDATCLRLILEALKFLPFINEAEQFTTRLLDLIELENKVVQHEILNSVLYIIPDNQSDNAAKQLSRLLEEYDELAGPIIDCLNSFTISTDTRLNIYEYIMDRLLTCTRYYKIFPILFEFLISDSKQDKLVNVLLKTRETLDNIMSAELSETVSYKAITFKKLECFSVHYKLLFDGFMTMLNTRKSCSDHKPVDILLMFMLHSTCNGKKKLIEIFFKKQIKAGLIKIVLFERVFEKYFVQQVFDDYFNSILEIARLLLKSGDNQAIEIGGVVYKSLFMNKLCSREQRQDLLYNLMMIMGLRNSKHTSIALKVMNTLLEIKQIHEHAMQLMGLLEKVEELDLNDVKMVFEIVCTVTCGKNSEHLGLKDELYIFVNKQLTNYLKLVTQKGIIAAVILAEHVATVQEEIEANLDETIDNVDAIPEGGAREAAVLLKKTYHRASIIPEMIGLYYDQLSLMIVSKHELDPYFLSWLFETITKDFQEMFLVGETPSPINDLKFTAQYLLNSESEVTEFLAINIGEMAIKESISQKSNITILSPHFKLLRLLHYKQNNGDLSSIDAIIGFPVIMPEFSTIDDLHIDQIKQVANCVYHCINWFRELISAFSSQTLKRTRAKVMSRLMSLIELEETLQECIDNVPDHKLPVCSFGISGMQSSKGMPVKKDSNKGPPKKKIKSAPLLNDTLASTSAVQQPKQKRRTSQKNDSIIKFREIDTDIIILLKYPLTISQTTLTPSTTLHLKQFKFLLNDLVYKLVILTSHKVSSLSNLNNVDPVNLITDCRKLLPTIHKQSSVIVRELENLLQSVDDRHDVKELFTDEANDLKTSYCIVLELYSLIFQWPGFQNTKHHNLLKDCLKCALSTDTTQSIIPLSKYITDFLNVITNTADQCLLLKSAVKMIEIIQALYSIQLDPKVRVLIVNTSEKFLMRKWFNSIGKQEKGKQSLLNIEYLIKAYLSDADVKTLCGLVGTLQDEAPNLKSSDDYLLMLGSIDKTNFYIFYRCLCTALADRVKQEVAALTNNEHLILWKTTTLTMQGLMTIAKIQNSKSNLSCFLKKSIIILKIFLSHGIPIMEIMLPSKPDRVVDILKTIQISTRFLHQLCCHTKKMKDASLISLVPHFRSTLESLVYRVKAALAANNCSEAFWMGNLKNKDLEGKDILSQSTITESTMGEEEEEELPAEESEDEENLILNPNNSDDQDTASEVFDIDF